MSINEGRNIITTTIILIAVSIALLMGIIYWSGVYTKKITQDAERIEGNLPENVENSKIKIKDVAIDQIHKSDMYVTIENEGMLSIEKVKVSVFKNNKVYTDNFPKKIDYPAEMLNLGFFKVARFAVFFDNVNDLTNYTKIEFIPTFRLSDGSLKQIDSAKEVWEFKK